MDDITHKDHGQASDPHAGHKMSNDHRSHDRHAGHSVAMFRDKFWLSFALTIPVVFWSFGYIPNGRFVRSRLGATYGAFAATNDDSATPESESATTFL